MEPTWIAETLGQTGFCVCPDFLNGDAFDFTVEDLHRIRGAGHFKTAGIGKGEQHQQDLKIRSDQTYWLDREQKSAAQDPLWERVDALKQAFNRNLFMGLNGFEGHYAAYSPGGFYQRHKDCFKGESGRMVSMIIYLNREWKPEHGGRLRIYEGETHQDIDPIGGTLVCFLSRETDHEVLFSHQDRFSFSGWFKVPGSLAV
jgi:SM-20-related protein